MDSLFYAMLTGHLIADFWLQPSKWVMCKQKNGWKSKHLFFHALIAAILPVLFTMQIELWWFVPVIFIVHYLVDFMKSKSRDGFVAFITDQTVHIGLLLGLSFLIYHPESAFLSQQFWIFSAGFVLVTTPTGILIGKFLQMITLTQNTPLKTNASAWIGMIERILILIFILAGHIQAIGFLVAAKSIFRFSETQKEGNPKAEYFLLGTLVSFLVAILVGMGIKNVL
ncbi:MAG TPA: DUF3307 domain-containing protein [Prolixibacteraceae bacterium]|nr:DUF3307 domain-containing protein [Prolixibacteraceae bacterium]